MFYSRGPGDSIRYLASNFPPQVAFQLVSVHWYKLCICLVLTTVALEGCRLCRSDARENINCNLSPDMCSSPDWLTASFKN